MMFIPNFMKIPHMVQKLLGQWDCHTNGWTDGHDGGDDDRSVFPSKKT